MSTGHRRTTGSHNHVDIYIGARGDQPDRPGGRLCGGLWPAHVETAGRVDADLPGHDRRDRVTGFFLPADRFLPSHAVGIISLVILAAAIAGRYIFHLAGAWRWIYAAGPVAAL